MVTDSCPSCPIIGDIDLRFVSEELFDKGFMMISVMVLGMLSLEMKVQADMMVHGNSLTAPHHFHQEISKCVSRLASAN